MQEVAAAHSAAALVAQEADTIKKVYHPSYIPPTSLVAACTAFVL